MNHFNGIIDLAEWIIEDDYEGIYPKGARDKTVYFSPKAPRHDVISANHRYLFKKSRACYPWQFWVELMAYRVGQLMGVPVPPAYVGFSDQEEKGKRVYGALIKWFYREPDETYVDGSRLMGDLIDNFDYKHGEQHNLTTILSVPLLNKPDYWASLLTFDTVIGNTDRHQDNWGVILPSDTQGKKPQMKRRLSPAFDNGTAMGHEHVEGNLFKFHDEEYTQRYLKRKNKAKHHMKWSLDEDIPMNFFDFMAKFAASFPETKSTIIGHLDFTQKQLEEALGGLVDIETDSDCRLSRERLEFTINLLVKRRDMLRDVLGG